MFRRKQRIHSIGLIVALTCFVEVGYAGPFVTGASGMVDFGLTIATPIAILIVIGLGIAAAVGKISWGWVFGAILGIACIFGSAQIVEWIRGLFGV